MVTINLTYPLRTDNNPVLDEVRSAVPFYTELNSEGITDVHRVIKEMGISESKAHDFHPITFIQKGTLSFGGFGFATVNDFAKCGS